MKKQLIFICIFAFLSALFATLYLYDIGQQNKNMTEPIKVVVANKKIEQGTIITSDMIKEQIVPKQYAQPKYLSNKNDFYTNNIPSFISIVPFEEGEQITSTKISAVSSDSGVSNTIPNDKRAITVIFDSQEVYGIVSPGSRIDLISIVEYESKSNNFEEASCVIAQNLLVLAVGNNVIGVSNTNKKEDVIPVSMPITMAVSLQEAQKIILAKEKGVLKVALRPSLDDTLKDNKIIKINDIFDNANPIHKTMNTQDKKLMNEMQKRQKEVNEIISKYSQR